MRGLGGEIKFIFEIYPFPFPYIGYVKKTKKKSVIIKICLLFERLEITAFVSAAVSMVVVARARSCKVVTQPALSTPQSTVAAFAVAACMLASMPRVVRRSARVVRLPSVHRSARVVHVVRRLAVRYHKVS